MQKQDVAPNERNDNTGQTSDDVKDSPQSHSNMLIEAGKESNISLVKVQTNPLPLLTFRLKTRTTTIHSTFFRMKFCYVSIPS